MKSYRTICRLPGGDAGTPAIALFSFPSDIITAKTVEEVIPALRKIEAAVKRGMYAAGFISYEASSAFDDACEVRSFSSPEHPLPLLRFGIYKSPEPFTLSGSSGTPDKLEFQPEISEAEYLAQVGKIKRYIYEGDIYQANFTFRTHASETPEPYELFLRISQAHPVPYASFIEADDFQIISNSPELFLEKNGNILRSDPMKGTARRSLSAAEDANFAKSLAADSKNRAENIMITDMVRNDMGKICVPGSISVDPLCRVDTYQSVHQMISSVHGTLAGNPDFSDILRALFPAASITGAPKIRAMQIIRETEKSPRGVYTGTIGCIIPDGDFCLSVAIRTLVCSLDRTELGIGSGIVADSVPGEEWRESLLKSRFASAEQPPEFKILETILYADGQFVKLDARLERMRASQIYFGRPWRECEIRRALDKEVLQEKSANFAKVRLLVDSEGNAEVEFSTLPVPGWTGEPIRVKISDERTDSGNLFLYHKTTNRKFYNAKFAEARNSGFDEIIFTNEKGEITEGAISNIFVRLNKKWFTPPVSCGLLPGIERASLINELEAVEKILYPSDLSAAEEILVCNSVRGSTAASKIN